MTQVLGQPLSDLPKWAKLPADIVMQVVQMKTDPESIQKLKDQQTDEALWDSIFPGI